MATSPRWLFQGFGGCEKTGSQPLTALQAEWLVSCPHPQSFVRLSLVPRTSLHFSVCRLSSLWDIIKTAHLLHFQCVIHRETCGCTRTHLLPTRVPLPYPSTFLNRYKHKKPEQPQPFPLRNSKRDKQQKF